MELALTVFVWGLIPGGALLALYGCAYLDAITKRAKAQTDADRMTQEFMRHPRP